MFVAGIHELEIEKKGVFQDASTLMSQTNLDECIKELIDTAATIYKKIQDMEYESRIYYQQHNTLNQELQKKLDSYNNFYTQLITSTDPEHLALEKINSQPGLTLGGQSEDAQLKATSGYYQYFIWSILAALTFSYTMFNLKR